MCSNFTPIKVSREAWVNLNFKCSLPKDAWRSEVYPTQSAPFIYLDDGNPKCGLAEFGLRPFWAKEKKYGTRTYNARSETVAEKSSYKNAWKNKQFGLAILENFFEPNWETGKAIRWGIARKDAQPIAVASIWERFIDKDTGEVVFSFSMLTVDAEGHSVMKHFHKPNDEKRSIVVLQNSDYLSWLHADNQAATNLLKVSGEDFLISSPSPLPNQIKNLR